MSSANCSLSLCSTVLFPHIVLHVHYACCLQTVLLACLCSTVPSPPIILHFHYVHCLQTVLLACLCSTVLSHRTVLCVHNVYSIAAFLGCMWHCSILPHHSLCSVSVLCGLLVCLCNQFVAVIWLTFCSTCSNTCGSGVGSVVDGSNSDWMVLCSL